MDRFVTILLLSANRVNRSPWTIARSCITMDADGTVQAARREIK